ncbi:hypothetical protein [Neisseria sp.]|uniref:hypothetical protein n=1 Tax=Neisseria sp. TaxID=192066 RepID=UPI0026DC166F|nr:hypothetical protein [Neisseria sp.]MDO4907238.1 hypothetical protein [Neisseria sp.]
MRELFKIILNEKYGYGLNKVVHSNEYGILPSPKFLSIVQYDGDSGFYLIHLDADLNEQSDTYHETLESAFEQAEFEFNVQPSEWQKVSNS